MDPYSVLGLNPSATAEDVKAAWRRLARKHHPDRKGGSQEMMSQINSAYNLLMDAEARRRYDAGEGEEVLPLDVRASNALMQITFAGLTQSQVAYGVQNIHDFIVHHIKNNLDTFKGKLAENEKLLARSEAQRKNLLFKNPGSCIEMVFDNVRDGCLEFQAKCREDIKVMERAKVMYKEIVELDSAVAAQREHDAKMIAKAKSRLTFGGIDNPLLDPNRGL